MRTILLLLNGLGDRGYDIYGGKTPLQVASTPNLDRIAKMSVTGLYHSFVPGIAMSSEAAHFLLFGYDHAAFPGRGPIEAIGYGVPLKDGDVAVLARILSTIPEKGVLIVENEDPDADRKTCERLHGVIETFQADGLTFTFHPSEGVEGILVIEGNASDKITDSNPIYERQPLMEVHPHDVGGKERERARITARALNRYLLWCHRRLSEHPVNREREKKGLLPINALGTQRAGKKRKIEPFREKWGMRGLSISSGAIYHGLCRMLAMDTWMITERGGAEKELREKLVRAYEAKEYEFIHVHTKAPDAAAHTKDPERKRTDIESLDSALAFAANEIVRDDEILLVITSDHSTPSSGMMIHSGEPVPLMMRGKYARVDDVEEFNELSCSRGGLGLLRGAELMHYILNLTDRGNLWGLRDSSANPPYHSGSFRPLKIE